MCRQNPPKSNIKTNAAVAKFSKNKCIVGAAKWCYKILRDEKMFKLASNPHKVSKDSSQGCRGTI